MEVYAEIARLNRAVRTILQPNARGFEPVHTARHGRSSQEERVKEAKLSSAQSLGAEGVALVAHLQQRREQERSQLARMLHHDVAGMLAAARMDLSRVSGRVADDDLQEQLRRIDHLLEQAIKDARREMQRLHPALLDHFGLPMALRHLVEETCRERELRYTVTLDESMEGVDPELMIAAFRLVETLLGDGTGLAEFTARLAPRRDGYVLEVVRVAAGAGTAADPAQARDLDSLRTWLRSLGATWLESNDGGKSVLELRIPRPAVARKDETPGG
jgi:glucose-6-phosphate-specific signal transduction histidine kinase